MPAFEGASRTPTTEILSANRPTVLSLTWRLVRKLSYKALRRGLSCRMSSSEATTVRTVERSAGDAATTDNGCESSFSHAVNSNDAKQTRATRALWKKLADITGRLPQKHSTENSNKKAPLDDSSRALENRKWSRFRPFNQLRLRRVKKPVTASASRPKVDGSGTAS